MRLALYLTDGSELEAGDFDEASALELLEAWEAGDQRTGSLVLDTARVTFAWEHVTRVDMDWEPRP